MELVTFGCAVSQAESEIIAGIIAERGLMEADVVVVNTCTVKSPTETKIVRLLRKLEAEGRRVVVAGCMPSARPGLADEFPAFSFIGVNTHDVADAVKAASDGGRLVRIAEPADKTALPRRLMNRAVGIVPIAEGCLGGCSYCQTRLARGGLKSCPPRSIIRQVEEMLSCGVREVWLTGQDTGAYGLDLKTNLPKLLNALSGVEGDFMMRVGMMNPDHAAGMLDELLESYRSPKVYGFLHLPVQSGDDRVLKDMNRKYTVDDFRAVAAAFRRIGATLSTDVIVGYPTESEGAFENTVALIEEAKPDILNSTRYWPRPGTAAAALRQLPGGTVKARSRRMADVFKRVGLERNGRWAGWRGSCLVSEENPDGTCTARNRWYKPIVVPGGVLGERIEVEVTGHTYYDLRGRAVQ